MLIQFLIALFAAYLIGSIPFGILIARALKRVDLRAHGSGHTGAMNALRSAGKTAGVLTFLADAGKAIFAIFLARQLTGDEWASALAGVLVITGHILPIYTRFHGGMGLAPSIGALFVFAPLALAAIIALWFPLKFFLKQSLYASMSVALLLTPILFLLRADPATYFFGAAASAIIFARHLADLPRTRSN